jgi:hypothetical protein
LEVEAHPRRNSESNTGLGVPVEGPRPTSSNFSARKKGFVLDRTLFHAVDSEETPAVPSSCRSPSPEKEQNLSILDFEEPSFYIAWKARQREIYGEDWTPVPASPVPPEPEHDHLAEFEEWLATTDSIEIVR